jgi:hypothetical protein
LHVFEKLSHDPLQQSVSTLHESAVDAQPFVTHEKEPLESQKRPAQHVPPPPQYSPDARHPVADPPVPGPPPIEVPELGAANA